MPNSLACLREPPQSSNRVDLMGCINNPLVLTMVFSCLSESCLEKNLQQFPSSRYQWIAPSTLRIIGVSVRQSRNSGLSSHLALALMKLGCLIAIFALHREEQVLIISGGLTIHNLRDFPSFAEETAAPHYKEFDRAILEAVGEQDVCSIEPSRYYVSCQS